MLARQAVWQGRHERCVGQRGKDLMQNDQRLLDFPRAHHEPCPDISAVFHGHVEMKALVGIVRMIPAQVAIHAGRTSGHPDNPQISRGLLRENAGAIDAVGERAGIDQQADQIVELLLESMQVRAKRIARLRRQVALHAAKGDGPPQQSRAEQSVLQPDETFAQCLRATRRHGERTSVASAPISAMWLYIRSSSSNTTRSARARAGTVISARRSIACA